MAQNTRTFQVGADVLRLPMSHDWPGNAGELENTAEHGVVLCLEITICPEHLPQWLHPTSLSFPNATILESCECELVVRALKQNHDNRLGEHPRCWWAIGTSSRTQLRCGPRQQPEMIRSQRSAGAGFSMASTRTGPRSTTCLRAVLTFTALSLAVAACGARASLSTSDNAERSGGSPNPPAGAAQPHADSGPPAGVGGTGRREDSASWTLIALPDTQRYSLENPEILASQTRWIVDNRERLNIQMVMHEGDIVDQWDSVAQWNAAEAGLRWLIDASIPFTPTPGDHDHQGETPDGSTQYFYQYFPETRFNDDPWWGGDYNDNTNHYVLLTISNDDYIFIGVDFCPSPDEIAWANVVLFTYSSRKAIMVTHALIDDNGDYFGTSDCSRYQGDTSFIWNDLIRHHDNLRLVLCGHMHLNDGEHHRTVMNLNDVPVHQVLADYQTREQGGNGRLRIMTFVPMLDEIQVQTYSPYADAFETDADSQFTLPYEMEGAD